MDGSDLSQWISVLDSLPPPPRSFAQACLGTKYQFSEWTEEEKQQFDTALAEFNLEVPELFDYLTMKTPGKSLEQILDRFIYLLDNNPNEEELEVEDSNESDSSAEFLGKKKRKKRVPWTKEEHRLFLLGIEEYGTGKWQKIQKNFVKTKTTKQITSHAQKYFLRLYSSKGPSKRHKSIFDIQTRDPSMTSNPPKEIRDNPIAPSPISGSCPDSPQNVEKNLSFEGLGKIPKKHSVSVPPPLGAPPMNNNDGECMNFSMNGMGTSSNIMMNETPLYLHLPIPSSSKFRWPTRT